MHNSGLPSRFSRRIQQLKRQVFEPRGDDEPPVSAISLHAVIGLSAVIAFVLMEMRELSFTDAGMIFLACVPVLGILGLVMRPVAAAAGLTDGGLMPLVVIVLVVCGGLWLASRGSPPAGPRSGQDLHTR